MPQNYFKASRGPQFPGSLTQETGTAPADTDDSTNKINLLEPLLWDAPSGGGAQTRVLKKCAADDVPDVIAYEVGVVPNQPVSVRPVGQKFTEWIPFSGSVPAPSAGVVPGAAADGNGAWELVNSGGIGKLIDVDGQLALVEFGS